MIGEYNSAVTIPQLVFLGLDENDKAGLRWKTYLGAPFFALDVTPKGTIEKEANELVAEMEKRGLVFLQGRLQTSLTAPEGSYSTPFSPPNIRHESQDRNQQIPTETAF